MLEARKWIWPLLLLLAACATTTAPDGELENLRAELSALESNPELVELVPLAVAEARAAVRLALQERLSKDERAQRVWIARKRIEIARASAFLEQARRNLDALEQARQRLLLKASRLEAEQARKAAEAALSASAATVEEIERVRGEALSAEEQRQQAAMEAERARQEAEQARRLAEAQAAEIELAKREAELASETAASLQRRLEYMQYRQTDQGVVVTLGDVLFETGKAELHPEAARHLDDVIELLNSEPDKRIRIEGHTDSTGPAELNLRLSRARAEAVRQALIDRGIDASRIDAVGMGEDFPIASNDTPEGRARNRRVDVIVLNDR
ncbi:MAG: hypothetical protein Kow0020_08670 [Wenzhouxiangellaceae bacterium]